MSLLLLAMWLFQADDATQWAGSDRFEQAVYKEETLGDLDGAIFVYQQIVGDESQERGLRARAMFRLGRCHLKRGRDQEGWGIYARLIALYPEQEELVARAREVVPAELLSLARGAQPPLLPPPWPDGEVLVYRVLDDQGGHGVVSLSLRKVVHEGREVWRHRGNCNTGFYTGVVEVFFEIGSLAPIGTRMDLPGRGKVQSTYTPDKVTFSVARQEGTHRQEVQTDHLVYPVEQTAALLRCFDFNRGNQTSFSYFVEIMGQMFDLPYRDVGRETVTVPAGTFACRRLETVLDQPAWMELAPPRRLVRLWVVNHFYELVGSYRQAVGEKLTTTLEGMQLTLPYQWYPCPTETAHRWELLADHYAVRVYLQQEDGKGADVRTGLVDYAVLKQEALAGGGDAELGGYRGGMQRWRAQKPLAGTWVSLEAHLPEALSEAYLPVLRDVFEGLTIAP